MKTMQLLLFVLFCNYMQAQTAQQARVDSLCHSLDRFSTFEIERQEARDGSRGFITYLVHLGRETRKDSTQLADKIYLDKEVPMIGWYDFGINTFILSGGPIFLVGANFLGDSGMGLASSFSDSDIMSVHVIGCFNEGVPCCKWDYTEGWGHVDPRKEFIKKTEHYKEGLLDGDYVVYTHLGDTLYHTTFTHGTGVYQDYFPDGTLRVQGMIKDGYRDGTWIYYSYKDNKYTGGTIEIYKNKRYETSETFETTSALRERWEQAQKKKKKKWF